MAVQGKADLIPQFVANGADINQRDKNNQQTPLGIALRVGNKEFALCLLELGADPNVRSYGLLPPLFLAVVLNDVEVLEAMIEKGADVTRGNADYSDVFEFVIERRQFEMLPTLIQAFPKDGMSRGALRRLRFVAEASGDEALIKAIAAHETPALTEILDARKPAAPAMRM